MQSKKLKLKSKNSGFTLIEMLISSGLFTIIILIGIGAVLTVTSVHKKNQKLRSVIDTISFAMEDIARNARLGSAYNCGDNGIDCTLDWSYQFSFERLDGDWDPVTGTGDEYVYRIVPSQNGSYYTLEKSEFGLSSSGSDYYQILPNEVQLYAEKSGFKVSGSPLLDGLQPYVRIRLAGVIDYRGVVTPFALETTISQRQVDQ
jgi:prepilin-type N-terminal cleavage/methylation domain-containing protein